MAIFNRKKGYREMLETVASVKEELDLFKQEMMHFQQEIQAELKTVKGNFDSLVHYLEAAHPEDEVEEQTAEDRVPELTAADLLNLKQDILYLKRGVMDLLEWTETMEPAFKTVHDRINDARKDIKDKITYAMSRLKT